MNDVNLKITAGLPYARRIRIKDGKNVWPSLDDLEVRSEVRVGVSSTSKLKATLRPFITPSFDLNDLILDLQMTGNATRSLLGGYYDIVVSDVGPTDTRAIKVVGGTLTVEKLVTAGTDG